MTLEQTPRAATVAAKKENQLYFLVGYALIMLLTMIMQFYVTSVKLGSTSNVIILTILTTDIYKVVMSHGIAFLVSIYSFHLVI